MGSGKTGSWKVGAHALAVMGIFQASAALSEEPGPPSSTTPAENAPAALQEVVVTGTHIRGADVAGVVNVQALERDELERSGATQMMDLVKEIPSNAGTTQYNESGQLSGTAQFELRGLGFSSTLVLLNGRRAGVAPLSDKSGADFVDINQFPLAMVERLDVLKDGSSAIYGSEAVAGVVNIVTRKGFEGIELSSDYTSSSNDAWSINLASGHRFEQGSFNFYATYYNQTGNLRGDFPWLMARVGGNGTPGNSQLINNNGFPGTYQLATTNAAGRPTAVSGAPTVADPNCQAAGGVFPISASGIVNSSTCDINFANQIAIIPDVHRIQSFFEGDYELADGVSYFNESSASRNDNNLAENPGSFANGAAVGGLSYIPATAPFNFFIRNPNNPKGIVAVDPAQWNPAVDQAVAVVGNLRPQGSYISAQKEQIDTYLRMVNGINIDLPARWQASVSEEYAFGEFQELNPLAENATALNSLIASGAYNPFGTSVTDPALVSPKNGTSTAANPAAVLNQIFYTSNVLRRTEQNVADVAASGPLLTLPTGTISAALGGQYRNQSLRYTPDSIAAAGLGSSSTTDASFTGREHVWAEYAEAVVPFYSLASLQAAVRHEDYGSGIGATTNPKLSGRLNVLSDRLSLRGSWGTSFQAPTLTQNATTNLISTVNDPVVFGTSGPSCAPTSVGTGTTVITSGGNLQPQTSTNFDLGVDLKPARSLNLSGDYWHYQYTNLIAAGENAQAIVSGECVNGVYVTDPRVARTAGGLLDSITTAYVNVGKVIADGVDLSATYSVSLDGWGAISARADATYVNRFDAYGANGAVSHDVGSRNFNDNFAPMPRWRGSARALWSKSIYELSAAVNFIGSYANDQDFNAPIAGFTTMDWQYAMHLEGLLREKKGATVMAIGMNNALNQDPPALTRYTSSGALITGPTAIDRPGYDALSGANIQGRMLYVRLKQTF